MSEENTVIWISSTRDRHAFGPACHLVWEELEWYASVAEVRRTAMHLFIAAAYGDMIGEMLKLGLEPGLLTGLISGVLSNSDAVKALRDKHDRSPTLGGKHTVHVLPVGSSRHKTGGVRVSRGQKTADLDTGEAVTMAGHWLTAAEASESDTLFGQVVERAGLLTEFDVDALFGLLTDIRGGQAQLPPVR